MLRNALGPAAFACKTNKGEIVRWVMCEDFCIAFHFFRLVRHQKLINKSAKCFDTHHPTSPTQKSGSRKKATQRGTPCLPFRLGSVIYLYGYYQSVRHAERRNKRG